MHALASQCTSQSAPPKANRPCDEQKLRSPVQRQPFGGSASALGRLLLMMNYRQTNLATEPTLADRHGRRGAVAEEDCGRDERGGQVR
ncbi:MAG: hypothetical protein JWN34_510 [Bryobacterales bacterium]|nr:hypothetical protein [Bryobacterales bacterium]